MTYRARIRQLKAAAFEIVLSAVEAGSTEQVPQPLWWSQSETIQPRGAT